MLFYLTTKKKIAKLIKYNSIDGYLIFTGEDLNRKKNGKGKDYFDYNIIFI